MSAKDELARIIDGLNHDIADHEHALLVLKRERCMRYSDLMRMPDSDHYRRHGALDIKTAREIEWRP